MKGHLSTVKLRKKKERKGRETESHRANEAEKERDALKDFLERERKTNAEMMEKNCLQLSNIDLTLFLITLFS